MGIDLFIKGGRSAITHPKYHRSRVASGTASACGDHPELRVCLPLQAAGILTSGTFAKGGRVFVDIIPAFLDDMRRLVLELRHSGIHVRSRAMTVSVDTTRAVMYALGVYSSEAEKSLKPRKVFRFEFSKRDAKRLVEVHENHARGPAIKSADFIGLRRQTARGEAA